MGDGRIVLGIDPGLAALGYGLIRVGASGAEYLEHGCLVTRPPNPLADRLHALYRELSRIRSKHAVTDVAMESLFRLRGLYSQATGEARGVAVLAAVTDGAQLFEYSPTEIKEAVTGSGAAGKRQVQEMVRLVLGLSEIPRPDDAADALAVALCHARRLDLERMVAAGRAAAPT